MADAQTEPKLLLPFLRPFYDAAIPLSWLIVRVAVGWNLLVHGWGKIMAGPTAAFLKGYSDMGFTPAEMWFWSSTAVETTAGVALILGLFTRFFAAAAAIEIADHHADLLENRLRLDPARLRIHADVGPDQLRHRAARRRPVFARPQARAGALDRTPQASRPCVSPASPLNTAPRRSSLLNSERWQSGRMHRTRNAAYGQPYRGFESLPLRQFVLQSASSPADRKSSGHNSFAALRVALMYDAPGAGDRVCRISEFYC